MNQLQRMVMMSITDSDTKLFVEENSDSNNNNNLLYFKDRNKFSGFDKVLFNKHMTNLIHCPVIAKGEYIIPLTVETIGIEAFSQCRGITSILLPEGVKKIECMAFANCTGLNTLTIPGSVDEIGFRSFSDCSGLRSLYVLSASVLILKKDSQVFHKIDKSNCTLYVMQGTKKEYQLAPQWEEFQNIIEIN